MVMLPKTQTGDLQQYLDEDPKVSAVGSKGLFEAYAAPIRAIVDQILRGRFRELSSDAVQEAWLDCLSQLHEKRDDFLKERHERPPFGSLVTAVTMRAIWRLSQRTRRQVARDAPLESSSSQASPSNNADAVSGMTTHDFHRIFVLAWQRLLEQTPADQRCVLADVGDLEFFAGDWKTTPEQAASSVTSIVLERRAAARSIVDDILAREFGFEPRVRTRFVTTLIP
jgi:hypothetical protein